MSTNPEPGMGHSESAWERNIDKIDAQFHEFFTDAKGNFAEHYQEFEVRFKNWLDTQTWDEKAQAEWEKLKSDSKLMRAKLENRATHLVQDGKIKLADFKASLRK